VPDSTKCVRQKTIYENAFAMATIIRYFNSLKSLPGKAVNFASYCQTQEFDTQTNVYAINKVNIFLKIFFRKV